MGGNVVINTYEADCIDLSVINRTLFIHEIINFLRYLGIETPYFSGSSKHLFNTSIDNTELLQYKSSFGDLDIQIDHHQKESFDTLLKTFPQNSRHTTFIYRGYKLSNSQTITLWYSLSFKIHIQIDFEYVTFENFKPTPWSQFSHSSSWEDCCHNVKGLFKIYLLRAIQHRTAKEVKRKK